MKLRNRKNPNAPTYQPPSGGCVLKRRPPVRLRPCRHQPPSGGCVLKQRRLHGRHPKSAPAAFRRLCVETFHKHPNNPTYPDQPPSGGCVLKLPMVKVKAAADHPAAFRRLCVETRDGRKRVRPNTPAAFRRLCVETANLSLRRPERMASRLQAAVC